MHLADNTDKVPRCTKCNAVHAHAESPGLYVCMHCGHLDVIMRNGCVRPATEVEQLPDSPQARHAIREARQYVQARTKN